MLVKWTLSSDVSTTHNKTRTVYSIWIHATYCIPDQKENAIDFRETLMLSYEYELDLAFV